MYRLAKSGVVRLSDGALIKRYDSDWEGYRAFLQSGGIPEPMLDLDPSILSEAEINARLSVVVQNYLDDTAKVRGFYNIISACSYVTSTNANYKAEAEACISFRDAVWPAFYDILRRIKNDELMLPNEQELTAMLPRITWSD